MKCLACGHVARSHEEGKCAGHDCSGTFVAPSTCPLGHESHNRPRGHTCNCVPNQIDIFELL